MASRVEQAIANRDADALLEAIQESPSADEEIGAALFEAVMGSKPSILEFLLDVLKPEIDGCMMHLVSDEAILRLFVAHGGDINATQDSETDGSTPLHTAAYMGRLGVIPALVELGADINVRDLYGRTPLISAADSMGRNDIGQCIETIALLVRLGADPSATDYFGNGAAATYRFASKFEPREVNQQAVSWLIDIGSPDDRATIDLFNAIFEGDIDGVREAIARGADVNRVSPLPSGASAPECSASVGRTDMIQALLDAGADVNRISLSGTPLIEAAHRGHLHAVKHLIAVGADIEMLEPERLDEPDRVRRNAYLAAEYNSKYEVADYLKSLGSGMPKPVDWKPIQPGVGSWNDFSGLLVKADVPATALALAQMIEANVWFDAYGKSFTPGSRAYVLARPAGMAWTNVFQVTPPQQRWPDVDETARFAQELAEMADTSVLTIEYSDTSNATAVMRYEPTVSSIVDDGWDDDMLEEASDAIEECGEDVPEWMQRRLEAIDPNDPSLSSSERLVALAEQERFAVAKFSAYCAPGRRCEVAFPGYPAEAFDGVAFMSD